MSSKFTAMIAFSGGLESTYLAQLMLQQGHPVKLYYTNAYGRKPCSLEASLVYRCYEKLKAVFPDADLSLSYVDREFFGTHHSDNTRNRMLQTNQAMRIACLLTELQKYETEATYMCGWTGEGCQENNFNPGAYSTKQYEEMKQLPITLNQYTRITPKPSPILTPLWGMSKKEVYLKLHSELADVVVLNTVHGKISQSKIEEWEEAGLPVPTYVHQFNNGTINRHDLTNPFGLYFADGGDWALWIKHVSGVDVDRHNDLLYSASPMVRHVNLSSTPLSEIIWATENFQRMLTKYFTPSEKEKSHAN